MNRRYRLVLAATAATAALVLAGCSAFDGDDDRTPVSDSSLYAGIPATAIRAASGFGSLQYRATTPSRVIVGDDSRRAIIVDTTVQTGDEIVVNPEGDAVMVNGRVVYNQNIQKNNQHSIFVVPR